jgi:hypothetical protein
MKYIVPLILVVAMIGCVSKPIYEEKQLSKYWDGVVVYNNKERDICIEIVQDDDEFSAAVFYPGKRPPGSLFGKITGQDITLNYKNTHDVGTAKLRLSQNHAYAEGTWRSANGNIGEWFWRKRNEPCNSSDKYH